MPALKLNTGEGTTLIDSVDVTAPPAVGKGKSSVGVFVVSVTATIRNSRIEAGDGAPGEDGAPIGNMSPAQAGFPGELGCNANLTIHAPGNGGVNTCDGTVVSGGKPSGLGGPGGMGQGQGGTCTGGEGASASAGGAAGAAAAAIGILDSTGFGPATAPDAGVGPFGKGGGGGGGAGVCGDHAGWAGPGGGGGGAGGCGGAGGHGGAGGGGSVAVLAYEGTVSLVDVALLSAGGGKGGDGGNGQLGQVGGNPGSFGSANGDSAAVACNGGKGGNGARGGPGAGGHGGPSALILEAGSTITRDGPTDGDSVGSGGPAGTGSDNAGTAPLPAENGNIGPVCAKLTLPSEACVPLD